MHTPNQNAEIPLTGLLHDLGISAKNLVLNEVKLLKLQIESVGDDISRRLKLLVVFACLAILSLLPVLAAAIIGLGKYLDDQYWLSSLIVGFVACTVSSIFVHRQFSKIEEDAKAIEASSKDLKKVAERGVS